MPLPGEFFHSFRAVEEWLQGCAGAAPKPSNPVQKRHRVPFKSTHSYELSFQLLD